MGRGWFIGLAACFMLQPLLPCQADESASTLGIVAERPTEGRFVEHKGRFLVPYTTNIPGTEIKFTMIPVPPGKLKVEGEVTYYVELPPYWIGKTEVTWAEYHKFMELYKVFRRFKQLNLRPLTKAKEIDAVTAPTALYEPAYTYEVGDKSNQPAVSMRQYAAKQYTKWLSLISGEFYRLPSEAEWTYACRAGTDTQYYFGDDPDQLEKYAWYDKNTEESWLTGEVGTKLPNRWGLYDMHGNAAEWVLDGATGKRRAIVEGATVSAEDAIAWPTEEWKRLIMGGGLFDTADDCTCTSHHLSDYTWQSADADTPTSSGWFSGYEGQQVGFRIVRPLEVPSRQERNRYWDAQVESVKRDLEERRGRYFNIVGVVDAKLPAAIKNLPEED